jgi:glucose/mannose-6-phosphate isomerase
VIDLDDAAALRTADPQGMLDVVTALPSRCREGYAIGRSATGLPSAEGLSSIVFCGMGGSAIAGDVIRALGRDRLAVPVTVVRTAELPAHCGPDTLVVASSYSGDTAETVALFDEAVRRGCRVVASASGGRLADRAGGGALLRLPGGFVMPRAAFGGLALAPLGALEAMGLLRGLGVEVEEAASVLDDVVRAVGPAVPTSGNPAKSLARAVGERTPIVWGAEGIASVAAMRWAASFNENAKVPAFASALPELDHNEIVGWSTGRGLPFFLIALRHAGEPPDVAARFPLSMEIAAASGLDIEEVWGAGASPLARLLSLVLRGDLTTTYLAIARGVDPTPIEAIARLKRALSGSATETVGQ